MYFLFASCLYSELVHGICFKDYDDDFEDDDGDEENEDVDDDNKPVGNQRSIFLRFNIKCMFVVAIKILSHCFTKHQKHSFSVGMWLVVKNVIF